jgi:hypothetical protein
MHKQLSAMLGLLLGMAGTLFAQQRIYLQPGPEDQVFELPFYSIRNAWHIDLGSGNYLELELADITQLPRFRNVDSLLLVFLGDMRPFRDSLSSPLSGKRIDYLVDTSGRKLVRIRETAPSGASFLLGEGEPSILRLRQDTVHLLLLAPPAATGRRAGQLSYSRLTIVINRFRDLEDLVSTGLNNKMMKLGPSGNRKWEAKTAGVAQFISDPSITTKNDSVYSAGHEHDFLELQAFVNFQNYKAYFVPSAGVGLTIGFQRRFNLYTTGVHWEPLFFFAAGSQGRPQTYRNDLLVFNFAYRRTDRRPDAADHIGLITNLSFGWFIRREGDFVGNSSSFRLAAGNVSLMNDRFLVEPCIYFNNFFKGVTPGLRFSFKIL